ncbi:uncharacterized protein LOC114392296 isoform X2 [Glycine soja]|uniref:uncharacterized protein LOC114392296 isoform X2 n=1 Tax=Glycine soja TaxID=3848 RepID=UPI0003DE9138|nr:uncharacterized protein LOC114392296 isoform X2 [Glycine soja]
MAPPSSPPLVDNCDAERRLREAEERLRDAIEELQRRQRRAASHAQQHRHVDSPPCDHGPDESCLAHAIGNLCLTFLLSYGVRVGIGILLLAFKLVGGQSYSSLLDLKDVICMFNSFVANMIRWNG